MAEKSEVRNTVESFEHNNIILSIDLLCHLAILTKDTNPPRPLSHTHTKEKKYSREISFSFSGIDTAQKKVTVIINLSYCMSKRFIFFLRLNDE